MGYDFDKRSAKRIANAVKQWEATAPPYVNPPSDFRYGGDGRMWAVVTASDGTTNKYSWTALSPNADGSWLANSDWGSGDYTKPDGYLMEQTGFVYVPYGVPVEIRPAPTSDLFYYFFTFCGDVLPVTIDSFTAGGEGTATVAGGSQIVKYTDLSNGSVAAGTGATLSYCAGSPGTPGKWILISVSC